MKQNILFLLLYAIISLPAIAQKNKTVSSPTSAFPRDSLFALQEKIYNAAIRYNDLKAAQHALYAMIALQPGRTGLKDTLAYLYYNEGNYVQVVLLGKDILSAKPDNPEILELVAVSQQNLGLLKDALENFEKLYNITQNAVHRYNIASLQYMLKRYGECSESLNAILGLPDNPGNVTISTSTGESQQVPLKAAAFNMRGVIALEIGQPEVAIQNFQKALELFPDFVLAKGNLEKARAEKIPSEQKKQTPSKGQ
ncbi:MAG: hypothetical protein KatS3mg031_0666 [Chitinophagales bacterium]|nr:MAG: hypothetical protein KatS3mg031_0666 [Chitinophagales bacterium]